jgi:predicted permease
MKEIFAFSLNAVLPILLLMLLGYFLRQRGFFDDAFLKTANKLVFRVGLSVLLFYNVYSIDGLSDVAWVTVGYCVFMVLVLFFVGWLCAHVFVKDERRRGVLWQCTFRSNLAVIGMPLAQALGGAVGGAAVSVTNAFTIPLFNMLAVLALSAYVSDPQQSRATRLRGIGKKVITNPLIIGIALGFLCLGIRAFLPVDTDGIPVFSLQYDLPFLYTAIRYLSQLATPLALLVLGGQFRFDVLGGMKKEVLLGTFLRILIAPVLGLGVAVLLSQLGVLHLSNGDYAAFVALFGSPVAVSSAVMAGEMGNDDQLASQYVVWTSLGSMVTVFLMVVGLKSIGLL